MQFHRFTLFGVVAAVFSFPALEAETLTTLGTPGLIDMPSADVLDDGEIALTTNRFGETSRNTATFQILPRVYGTFRYSVIRGFDFGEDLFDRSFDLHYQIWDETETRPRWLLV